MYKNGSCKNTQVHMAVIKKQMPSKFQAAEWQGMHSKSDYLHSITVLWLLCSACTGYLTIVYANVGGGEM
jgi:hypothetical protein